MGSPFQAWLCPKGDKSACPGLFMTIVGRNEQALTVPELGRMLEVFS